MFSSFSMMGLIFIKMPLRPTNGPRLGSYLQKNASKGYKCPSHIVLQTFVLHNWALNMIMGVSNI